MNAINIYLQFSEFAKNSEKKIICLEKVDAFNLSKLHAEGYRDIVYFDKKYVFYHITHNFSPIGYYTYKRRGEPRKQISNDAFYQTIDYQKDLRGHINDFAIYG